MGRRILLDNQESTGSHPLGQIKNTKRELLAQNRANGMSWPDAYVAAGYTGKNPSDTVFKLLRINTDVNDRVEELLAMRAQASTVLHQYGKQEVLAGLLKNARLGQTPLPLHNNKGEETGNVKFDLTGSNRAWELLGMELGMFPKVSKLQHGKMDPLEGLTEEEVLTLTEQVFQRMDIEVDMDMLKQVLAMRQAGTAQHVPIAEKADAPTAE